MTCTYADVADDGITVRSVPDIAANMTVEHNRAIENAAAASKRTE